MGASSTPAQAAPSGPPSGRQDARPSAATASPAGRRDDPEAAVCRHPHPFAEDELIIRRSPRRCSKTWACQSTSPTTALEAIQRVETQAYALILMDMQMPKMDGLDATAAHSSDARKPAHPILAMTANAFVEDKSPAAWNRPAWTTPITKPRKSSRNGSTPRWQSGSGRAEGRRRRRRRILPPLAQCWKGRRPPSPARCSRLTWYIRRSAVSSR